MIGKEKDWESGLGDHGVRKYDYELGIFTSPDPLWEKYYAWTPYQYSMNNPVSFLDYDGNVVRAMDSKSKANIIRSVESQYEGLVSFDENNNVVLQNPERSEIAPLRASTLMNPEAIKDMSNFEKLSLLVNSPETIEVKSFEEYYVYKNASGDTKDGSILGGITLPPLGGPLNHQEDFKPFSKFSTNENIQIYIFNMSNLKNPEELPERTVASHEFVHALFQLMGLPASHFMNGRNDLLEESIENSEENTDK